MNVKSVEKENGKAKILVEIDKAQFEDALNKAYVKNKKDIFVPGFRKGKAPRKVIEGMYGASIFHEDAINILFPDIYEAAVVNQELKAVGAPSVTDMEVGQEGVLLTVETELYPEVTLGQYKGLEVPKADAVVTDEEVAAEIDRKAQESARILTVERPAQMGDTAVIDFEGFDNGVAFDGGKGEDYSLVLGSGSFVPGFEDQVVGMSAGESKDIDIVFPENYTPELAGKPVVFKVTVKEVKETIKPALDDEFAKDVSEFDTLEELKSDIKAKLLKEKEDQISAAFERAAVEMAANNMSCTVPQAMIEEEVDRQMNQFAYQLQMSGMKLEDYTKMIGGDLSVMRQRMRPIAETTVKNQLVLAEIAKEESLEVSEEEVEAEIAKMAEQYQMEVEKVKELVNAKDIQADMLAQKASKLVAENAKPVAVTAKKEEAEEAPKKKTTRKKAAAKEEADVAEQDEEAPKKKTTRKKAEKAEKTQE